MGKEQPKRGDAARNTKHRLQTEKAVSELIMWEFSPVNFGGPGLARCCTPLMLI